MDSLFSQLYYGNYTAGVEITVYDPEYRPLFDLYTKRDEAFISQLDAELKELYSRLTSLNEDIQALEQEAAYQYGLSLGLLLMSEALQYNCKR